MGSAVYNVTKVAQCELFCACNAQVFFTLSPWVPRANVMPQFRTLDTVCTVISHALASWMHTVYMAQKSA
jgi:hypothetical protein